MTNTNNRLDETLYYCQTDPRSVNPLHWDLVFCKTTSTVSRYLFRSFVVYLFYMVLYSLPRMVTGENRTPSYKYVLYLSIETAEKSKIQNLSATYLIQTPFFSSCCQQLHEYRICVLGKISGGPCRATAPPEISWPYN